MLDRFQAYFSGLSATIEGIGTSQKDKAKAIKILDEMAQGCQALEARIGKVREEIETAS